MSDEPPNPSPELQEDLQEAAFAVLRRLLEEAKRQLLGLGTEALLRRIDTALAGEPGGATFLARLRELEAEGAVLREDVLRYLAENVRIRGLLAALESCPHGCQGAGFCAHYARLRRLGLRGPLQTSAPAGDGG